jgi:hypothetical protein
MKESRRRPLEKPGYIIDLQTGENRIPLWGMSFSHAANFTTLSDMIQKTVAGYTCRLRS